MNEGRGPDGSPPTGIDGVKARLRAVAADFLLRVGRPPRVAIAGMPGSGKSRLFNRFVGAEVSAVSAEGYTTRRPVTGAIEGVTIVDTPSLRSGETKDGDLAAEILEADVILHVVNSTGRITDRDLALVDQMTRRRPVVIALNKVDVLSGRELSDILDAARICFDHLGIRPAPISAKAGTGLEKVLEQVAARLDTYEPAPDPDPESEVKSDGDSEPFFTTGLVVTLHATGAAVAVVVIVHSSLPFPWLDVVAVGFIQYLLVGYLGRSHGQTGGGFHSVRVGATALGTFLYFLLSGRLRVILPPVAMVIDAFAAFVTTAVVGYGVDRGLSLADRLLPAWLRKLIMGRLKDAGEPKKRG